KRVRVSRQMFLARRPSCIRPNNKKPARPWGLMRVFWFRWTPLDFQLAERVGFEPTVRGYRTPDFESGTFDHSATSPVSDFRAGQARWDAACGAGRRGRLADVRTFASEKTKTATISENFRLMCGTGRPPCRRWGCLPSSRRGWGLAGGCGSRAAKLEPGLPTRARPDPDRRIACSKEKSHWSPAPPAVSGWGSPPHSPSRAPIDRKSTRLHS